jgi:hypothetical protein
MRSGKQDEDERKDMNDGRVPMDMGYEGGEMCD